MPRGKKKRKETLGLIVCECGYQNQPYNVRYFGTCRGCGKVLDQKAYFDYMMNKKLMLWRKK